jgi:hypothetical protein
MNKAIALAGALVLVWAGPARAEDTHKKVYEEVIALMKDITKTLKTITDEDSAKAQTPALRKLGDKGKALQKRIAKLGKATKEEVADLAKMAPEIKDTNQKLKKETERVKKIKGGKEALKALEGTKDKKEADKGKKDE